MSRPLTVGTAGHIDHGKTALVRALTGHETDRLVEERERGISIELGFAPFCLGGRSLSLVDVPGHERFVRTMIAGASGIDLFLLVIAADDGVMPQTREHLTVLRALGVERGVLALSKCDVAGEDARALAARQARKLLPGAPLVEVSAKTGEGVAELRRALLTVVTGVDQVLPPFSAKDEAVLHVDRVFTIAGRGTVVTGTLWTGVVRCGDQIKVLPKGIIGRVREVQVHDHAVECAEPHQRIAINLARVRRSQIKRGDVLVSAVSAFAPTYRLDVELGVMSDLRDHERVQVHHGTRETPARMLRLADDLAQLRLEAPLIAAAGDRFVLRRISPPSTLGGGRVLDPHPCRHGLGPAVKRLRLIQAGELDPRAAMNSESEGELTSRGSSPVKYQAMPMPPTQLALRALNLLRCDGAMPRGAGTLAEDLGVERMEAFAALESLVMAGEVVRLKPDVFYPRDVYESLRRQTINLIELRGSITLAEARDALPVSRRYVQVLLEHLDSCRVTLRCGEHRVLRKRRTHDAE